MQINLIFIKSEKFFVYIDTHKINKNIQIKVT